jgi:hypothetical protein
MLRQQLRCFCANGHAKIKNEFTGSDSVAGELPALAGRAPHWITGAKAIGIPGCPDLAYCTASIDRVRLVLMQDCSRVASDPLPQSDRSVEPFIVRMAFVVIKRLLAIVGRNLLRPEKPPQSYKLCLN